MDPVELINTYCFLTVFDDTSQLHSSAGLPGNEREKPSFLGFNFPRSLHVPNSLDIMTGESL